MPFISITTKKLDFLWAVFTLVLLYFLTGGCEERPEPAVFPLIMTLPVTNIGSEGATFNVDLLNKGNQNITAFGFAWSKYRNSDITEDDRIFLDIPASAGKFSARISSTLEENQEYYVRSFIKTEEYLVYGTELKFVSKGSLPPVISGFSPDSVGWRDTITIKGSNYSFNRYNNKVYLGNVYCSVVSANDTLLKALVSETISTLENSLQVEVAGNTSNILPKKVTLNKPRITDYKPRKVRWGDTIIVKGYKLKYVNSLNGKAQLGDLVVSANTIDSDTCIGIKIPNTLENISNILKLTINGFVLSGNEPIELLQPFFDFSPKEGPIGTTITLEGRFKSNSASNQILLGTTPVSIISSSYTNITFAVPYNFINPLQKITYKSTPFEVTSDDEFKLTTGQWRYIPTPSVFFSNITGNHNRSNGISFSLNGKGYMIDFSKGKMSSYDPSTNVSKTLKTHSQFAGKAGLTVFIHNDTAIILERDYYYYSPSKFSYYDVSVDQWKQYGPSPSNLGYGGGFSLDGKIYYGLLRNTSEYYFQSTFKVFNKRTGIWVEVAQFPTVENTYVAASFSYNEIGYILLANKKLYSYNPVANSWQYVGTWPATGSSRYSPTVFIIDNLFYFGLGYSTGSSEVYSDIWTYDPATGQWTEVAKIPNSGRSSALTFVVGGKAYIGYGISTTTSLTDFYEFDPSFLK